MAGPNHESPIEPSIASPKHCEGRASRVEADRACRYAHVSVTVEIYAVVDLHIFRRASNFLVRLVRGAFGDDALIMRGGESVADEWLSSVIAGVDWTTR